MPGLNVTSVILDPLFCEQLVIYRREQTMVKGRTVLVPTLVVPGPWGVVLPQEDPPMIRGPDQQNVPRLLEVHTSYRMRGASTNAAGDKQFQPDLLVWDGSHFILNKPFDYSSYGPGFVRCQLSSVDAIDLEPQK